MNNNMSNKIKVGVIVALSIISIVSFINPVTADGNSRIGISMVDKHITIGDFQITVWLDPDELADAFVIYELTWEPISIVNGTKTVIGTWWNGGFGDPGEILNVTGIIKNPQAFRAGGTQDNLTACTVNFTANSCGKCYFNLTNVSAIFGGEVVNLTCFNNTITLHPYAPTNLDVKAHNETQLNLSWTKNFASDKTIVIKNETSIPTSIGDGTEVYNNTGTAYNDNNFTAGSTCYYSVWGWNNSGLVTSLLYSSASNTTMLDFDITLEYPQNLSTEIARPPNYAFNVTETGTYNIYVHFYNMTPVTDVWSYQIAEWSSQPAGRYEIVNLESLSPGTQFIWGNTTYYWCVNVSSGSQWINKTFTYNTIEFVDSQSARYDIDNSGTNINVVDLSISWAHRTVGAHVPYDGMYDVDNNGDVDTLDLSVIWAHRV